MAHISIVVRAACMSSHCCRPRHHLHIRCGSAIGLGSVRHSGSSHNNACGRASPAPGQTSIVVRHPRLPVRSAGLRPPAPPAGASAGVRQPLSRFSLLAGARVRAWGVPFCVLAVNDALCERAGLGRSQIIDSQNTKQRRLAIACMAGPAIQAVMSRNAIADLACARWPELETRIMIPLVADSG